MTFHCNSWAMACPAILVLAQHGCASSANSAQSETGGASYVLNTQGTGGLQSNPGKTGSGGTHVPIPTNSIDNTGGGTPSSASHVATGGNTPAASGGTTGFDQATYCNGLFTGRTCSQTQLSADVRTVNMLLVLDESSSMDSPPTAGAATKWSMMKQALAKSLTAVKDDINFGLLLFPYSEGGIPANSTNPADRCALPADPNLSVNIPVAAGATNLQVILDKVASQTPAGGTPTAQALRQAYTYFTTGNGKSLPGTKWLLLATDGGPNCNSALSCAANACTQNIDGNCGTSNNPNVNCCIDNGTNCLDEPATTAAIAQLAAAGINTFVIGIPGSESYADSLNSFAVAGNRPNPNAAANQKYYAVSTTSTLQDLTDAFSQITTQLLRSCDIQLNSTPLVSIDKINVAIDCFLQPALQSTPSPDASGVDGFYIDYDQKPAHLKLVGTPCDYMTTYGAHHVDIIEGCQTIN